MTERKVCEMKSSRNFFPLHKSELNLKEKIGFHLQFYITKFLEQDNVEKVKIGKKGGKHDFIAILLKRSGFDFPIVCLCIFCTRQCWAYVALCTGCSNKFGIVIQPKIS